MTLGQNIQNARRVQGLSQEALAEKIGVSRQALGKWEKDTALPGLDNLQALAAALGIGVDALLGAENADPAVPAVTLDALRDLLAARDAEEKRRRRLWGCAGGAVFIVLAGLLAGVALQYERQISALNQNYAAIQSSYAAQQAEYGQIVGNLATYKVPLIDMFLFVCEQVDSGIVTLSDDQTQMLQDAEVQMNSAKAQLQGTDYDRMLIYLTLPESGDETYAFTDKILEIAEKYYPDENVYLAGESTNEYEFEKSFAVDNKVVSIVSVLVVMLVLLFTFNSAGMPVLLILVIQGCIWLNFSFPTITGKYIFFLGYLIVSSIQMGANIDYAIVIASRYQELKSKMHHRDAIVETLNFAFPTIITSGSILSICGFLIGSMTSEPVIAGIGESLGRGTVISIIMVMFALPQILLIGSGIVDKTSFSVPSITEKKSGHGKVSVNGMVRGSINGTVHGIMHATVEGDIDLNLISGSANEEQDDEED